MGWFGLSGKEHGSRGKEVSENLKNESKSWENVAKSTSDPKHKWNAERAAQHAKEDADIFGDEEEWDGRWE